MITGHANNCYSALVKRVIFKTRISKMTKWIQESQRALLRSHC